MHFVQKLVVASSPTPCRWFILNSLHKGDVQTKNETRLQGSHIQTECDTTFKRILRYFVWLRVSGGYQLACATLQLAVSSVLHVHVQTQLSLRQ
jgi:hypothetical protein